MSATETLLTDPIKLIGLCWPDIKLYDKQAQIVRSVEANRVTVVPAGNMLGKDFIAGLIALTFFLSRSPCRVVTSSVDQDQLKNVLWGEIRRFIQTAAHPLPLLVNDLMIRRILPDGTLEPRSTIIGRVAKKGEGMLGQHIEIKADERPRTLMIFDEGSGIEDLAFDTAATWAHRILVIGNPFPCNNFFRRFVKEGDKPKADNSGTFYRKIIQIKALDSPNIHVGKQLIPGLIGKELYDERRLLWDPVMQSVSLDGEFYEGGEVLLYPPEWLNRAEQVHEADANGHRVDREIRYSQWVRELPAKQQATYSLKRILGCDPAEGGDHTVWTVADQLGILYQCGIRTVDTSTITGRTIALMKEYSIPPEDVLFDRGGGGKQHVDRLRSQNYNVRTVAFGEPASKDTGKYHIFTPFVSTEKREEHETKYVFKNRRAEMFGLLRYALLDPTNPFGFAISRKYTELRRQLSPLPLMFDGEGRLMLPPKNKPSANSNITTIKEILGCSPDHADSLVLCGFGMFNREVARKVGSAMF